MGRTNMSTYRIINRACTALLVLITCCCTAFPYVRSQEPLQNRVEATVLLIGCVIVEYSERSICGPYTVVLAYQPLEPKQDQLKTIWAKTDSCGYFALANLPGGRYSLAGVHIDKLGLLWYDPPEGAHYSDIFDPALMGNREGDEPWVKVYTEASESANRVFFPRPRKPKSWLEPLESSIYNLGYLVLTNERRKHASAWWIVHSYHYDSLNGEKFILGKEYYLPPIPEYFIEKYPNSDWAPLLQRLLKDEPPPL